MKASKFTCIIALNVNEKCNKNSYHSFRLNWIIPIYIFNKLTVNSYLKTQKNKIAEFKWCKTNNNCSSHLTLKALKVNGLLRSLTNHNPGIPLLRKCWEPHIIDFKTANCSLVDIWTGATFGPRAELWSCLM